MKRKVLALVLTAALTVQTFAVAAMAEENTTTSALTTETEAYDDDLTPVGTTFDYEGNTYEVLSYETCSLITVSADNMAETVEIPSQVTDPYGDTYTVSAVGEDAFSGAANVTKLVIPATVTTFAGGGRLTELETIDLSSENETLFLKDGVLFEKTEDGYALDLYPAASQAEAYVIPTDVTEIRSRAFYGAKSLKTLVISASVKTIGKEAVAAFANSAEIVFNTEEAPEELASPSVNLCDAEDNVIYFLNAQVYDDMTGETAHFLKNAEDSTYVTVETDGLTEEIENLIEENETSLSEEAVTEEKTEEETSEPAEAEESSSDENVTDPESSESPEESTEASEEVTDSEETLAEDSESTEELEEISDIEEEPEEEELAAMNASAKDVAEGWYYIRLSDSKLYMDSTGSSAGANIDIAFGKTDAQLFHVIKESDKSYYIVPYADSDLALDCKGGKLTEGTNVRQYRYNGSIGQLFTFYNDDTIVTYNGQTCLTASNENLELAAYDADHVDANTQKWNLEKAESPESKMDTSIKNGWYILRNAADSSLALDITDGLITSKANADVYTYNTENTDLYFYLKLNKASCTYYITPYNAQSMYLSVAGKTEGSNVYQTATAKKYVLRKNDSDGSYHIQLNGTTQCLTAESLAKEGNVSLTEYKADDSKQCWILKKTSEPSVTYVDSLKGWYNITSNAGSFSLDMAKGKGSSSTANADIYTTQSAPSDDSQLFFFELVDAANHYYTIRTYTNQSLYLTAKGNAYTSGTQIDQEAYTGKIGQKFRVIKNKDKTYRIVSAKSSAVLTAASAKSGANVTLQAYEGLTTQKWSKAKTSRSGDQLTTNLPNGIYEIHTAIGATSTRDTSTRVLSVDNSIMYNDSNIVINTDKKDATQKFYLQKNSDGTYKVIAVGAWRAVDITGSSSTAGTNVQMHTINGTAGQTWKILQTADGYTYFKSNTGLSLHVKGGKSADGTNVMAYTTLNKKAQKWILEASSYTNIDSGNYQIGLANGNRTSVIQVSNSKLTAGTRANQSMAQTFIITKKSANTCTIYNATSGKYVGLSGLQSSAVKWKIVSAGDAPGSFYIYKGTNNYLQANGSVATTPVKLSIMRTSVPNGWYDMNGATYYFKNGRPLTNTYVGKAFLGSDGKLFKGWAKATVTQSPYVAGYYYYWDGKNGGATDARPWMVKTGLWGSTTKKTYINNHNNYTYTKNSAPNITNYDVSKGNAYYIQVDTVNCFVQVFTNYPGTTNFNVPVVAFKTSPGLAPNETNTGHSYIKAQKNWQELMGPSYGQYVSLVNYADGEYFHSVACGLMNDSNVDAGQYNLLGQRASHGCMRLCVRNAYWIYAYVAVGTIVDISAGKYTLKTALIAQPKMTGAVPVDPTDPAYTGNYGYTDSGNYYGSYYF